MSSSTVTYMSVYSDFEAWRFHYVPGSEYPPSLDYVPGLEYPEYVAPSDDKVPIEDQPLPADASPTALSPGYVVDSDPEEDPEEDPKEDPTNYPADGGDDDNDDDEEEASEEDEEEHLAPIDSTASTPPPPRSPQTKIPSPPLPVLSPPLPLPLPPTHTSPVYTEAPLGYRAAMVQWRATSPSTHHPLLSSEIPPPPFLLPSIGNRDDIPEADMPLQKRACFSALASGFEVGESSDAATARQAGHALTISVDYGFIDTIDASIRASESRAMTTIGEVNKRVTNLAITQRQEAQELYVHFEDAQDD
ncbi:hypothetical protein Tco_1245080 [Tanacetum coccineum]